MSVLRSNPRPGEDGHQVPVLSIAPQVLASLAATLDHHPGAPTVEDVGVGVGVGLHRVLARIRTFAKRHLGFEYVFDTSFARHVAHREHVREFEERSAAARVAALDDGDGKSKAKAKEVQLQLPMLASACPGWVCYAEKTHGQLLPFMSATKSPQQIMGTIVKRWLGRRVGKQCVFVLSNSAHKIGTENINETLWYISDQVKFITSLLCRATTRNSKRPGKISTTSSTVRETSTV